MYMYNNDDDASYYRCYWNLFRRGVSLQYPRPL